jgi:hypothetical protein
LRALRLISADFFNRKARKDFTQRAQRFEFIKLLLFPYPELTLNNDKVSNKRKKKCKFALQIIKKASF